MRGRALIVIALALVLGAASIFLVRAWTESRIRAAGANSNVAMTTMVVARTPLGFGARVRDSVLEEVPWPANAVVPESFRTIKELTGGEQGEERVVLRQIEKGEPVLKSKVSGFGQRPSLSAKISKGMRAATIRVNDVLGVGGFVLPGDRVDIMLTRNLGDGGGRGSGKLVTDLLLQNVKVLGIDQIANEDKEQARVARSVTLEVTPQQAQKLTLALRVGTLSLTLRNYGAAENAGTRRVTVSDLNVFEVNKPKAPAPKVVKKKKTRRVARKKTAKDPYSTVKILRGLKEDSEKVPTEAPDPLYPGQSIVAPSAPTSLLPNTARSGAPAAKKTNPAAMTEEPKKAPSETESATPTFKKAPIGLPLGPVEQTASPVDKDA